MKIKMVSLFIALATLISFTFINVFASENSKIYTYNDFIVKYTVTNEWENSQNISIVVTNTSNEPIENWMLSYDFFC